MRKNTLNIPFLLAIALWLTSCASSNGFMNSIGRAGSSVGQVNSNTAGLSDPGMWQGNSGTVWAKLTHIPLKQLDSTEASYSGDQAGWIKLAAISKRYSTNTGELVQQLTAWRHQYPNHSGNQLFPDDATLNSLTNTPPPKNIAVLLPLQGPYGRMGQAVRDGFLNGYYGMSSKTSYRQDISFYDTSQKSPSALYQQAVARGANIVIGPLTKDNVQELLNHGSFSVPTLALNYTDSYLPNNFYEFGLSPNDEAQQAADKAKQTGRSRAIIIAAQNKWTQQVIKKLTARWQSQGGSIVDTFYFTPHTDLAAGIANLLHIDPKADHEKMQKENNKETLEQQRRQDFDVIFLLAPPESAREVVPLLKYYYAGNVPIYSTSVIYSGKPAPEKDTDLNGVMFFDTPWTLRIAGTSSTGGEARFNRLFAVGRDAYLLSRELPRLAKLPNFPIYASTGALTLNSQQQIYRRLPLAKIQNGRP